MGDDDGDVARRPSPDAAVGAQPRHGRGDRARAHERLVPAGFPPAGAAAGDGRSREGRRPRRAPDRRGADDGRALDARAGAGMDPPVDPGGQPGQGARTGIAAAHDAGHRRRAAGAPGGRPHRAQHRPRDHEWPGGGERDRDARPRRGAGPAARDAPRCVPHLHQPRRRRLRAGRRAEERRGDRLRHRPRPRRRRQHPLDGDDARAGRAHPARRGDGRRGGHVRRPRRVWATS